MRLTIVRHARAGVKRDWKGPDELRPLDAVGAAQAAALGPLLAAETVRRLISSPTVRCAQTLQPAADLLEIPIETWDALGPDAGASGLRSTLDDPAFDDAVLCTHGEVLRPFLRTLRRRGVGHDRAELHGRRLLVKGSAWRVTLGPDGAVTAFEHLPPVRRITPDR